MAATLKARSTSLFQDPSVKTGTIVFLALRVFLTVWAIVVLTILPLPAEPDENTRPYLGLPVLDGRAARSGSA